MQKKFQKQESLIKKKITFQIFFFELRFFLNSFGTVPSTQMVKGNFILFVFFGFFFWGGAFSFFFSFVWRERESRVEKQIWGLWCMCVLCVIPSVNNKTPWRYEVVITS